MNIPGIDARTTGQEDLVLLSEFLGMSGLVKRQSDLTGAFDHLLKEASRLTRAQHSTLYLIDKTRDILTSYVGEKSERLQIRLPLGQGVAGHVASTGNPVCTNTPYESPLFDASWDDKTGFTTESLLTVPIRLPDGALSGVLQAVNSREGAFSQEDAQTLATFATHMGIAIENIRLYEDIKLTLRSTMRALAASIDSRDPVTAGHTERVTFYSVRAGQYLGLSPSQLTTLELAASMHDIGKIGVPDAVLQKPGRLTQEEFEAIKQHAAIGRDILEKVYFSLSCQNVPFLAGAHHERIDGSGYPDGLAGDSIPIEARIMAVADVFDAVTAHDRPYRAAMSIEDGLALIESDAPHKLDSEIVAVFRDQQIYSRNECGEGETLTGQRIHCKLLPSSRTSERHAPTAKPGGLRLSLLFVTRMFLPSGASVQLTIENNAERVETLASIESIERIGRTAEFEVMANLLTSAPRDIDFLLTIPGIGYSRHQHYGAQCDQ